MHQNYRIIISSKFLQNNHYDSNYNWISGYDYGTQGLIWNWRANFLPKAMRWRLFAWRLKFGEIDPWWPVVVNLCVACLLSYKQGCLYKLARMFLFTTNFDSEILAGYLIRFNFLNICTIFCGLDSKILISAVIFTNKTFLSKFFLCHFVVKCICNILVWPAFSFLAISNYK